MIAYYEFTEALYNTLLANENVNTVLVGGVDEIDTNKQTMFPLAHVLVGQAEFPNMGTVRFSVTVSVMDIIDIEKNSKETITDSDRWKGISNKQDILNTMLAVIEQTTKALDQETIITGAELVGRGSAEPFEDRFENLLTGWSITYIVDVINTVQGC